MNNLTPVASYLANETPASPAAVALAVVRMTTPVTKAEFLRRANGRCRTRLFDGDDYAAFCEALAAATQALAEGRPYYASGDAGGVCRSYGYPADSARWGAWVEFSDPVKGLHVRHEVGRGRCNGGGGVACPRPGGEQQYMAEWEKHFSEVH